MSREIRENLLIYYVTVNNEHDTNDGSVSCTKLRVPNREKNSLIFMLCFLKSFLTPRIPGNGIMSMLKQIWGFFSNQSIGHFFRVGHGHHFLKKKRMNLDAIYAELLKRTYFQNILNIWIYEYKNFQNRHNCMKTFIVLLQR